MAPLLVCAALLWLPGAALAVALRLPTRVALLAAPGLTAGLVGAGSILVPLLDLRWGPVSAAGVLAVALLVAALISRGWPTTGRRPHRAGTWRRRADGTGARTPRAAGVSRGPAMLAGAGVLVAAAVLATTAVAAGFRLDAVSQLWDAVWHAGLTTRIVETGDSSPSAAGPLLGAGWRDVRSSYPTGMHALAALVTTVAGAGAAGAGGGAAVVTALHAVLVLHVVLVLPAVVAALVWELASGASGGLGSGARGVSTGLGAGVAAVVSVLPQVFPLDHWWRPAWPTAVAFVLAALTCATALRCARAAREGDVTRRAALAASLLCVLGTAAVHPTGGIVVALAAGAWALGRVAGWQGRRRPLGLAVAAAVVGLGGGAVALASTRVPALASLFSYDYRTHGSAAAAVVQVLGLTVPVAPGTGYGVPDDGPQVLLAVLVGAAAVVVLATRGLRWLGGLWVLLVLAAADTFAPVAPPLHLLTGFFFGGQARLVALVALLGAVLVGVAVVRLAPLLAPRRAVAAVTGLALAAVLTAVTVDTAHRAAPRMAAAYGDRVVGEDQRAVMAALAAQPGARDGAVANDPADGSAWLYALTGLQPLFLHYNAHRPTGDGALLLQRLDAIDTDPAVRAALERLGVCSVYANTTTVSDRQQRAPGFADLDDAASLQLVARSGTASAYRVVPPVAGCDG